MEGQQVIKQKDKLFTPSFTFVAILSLVINGLTSMLLTLIPLYMKNLGTTDLLAGLATTGFTVSSIIFRTTAGKTVGRHGVRWPLIIGMIICTAVTLLSGAWRLPLLIILCRVLYGCGMCFAGTAIGKLSADNIVKSRLLEGMGYIGLAGALANSAGTAIAVSGSNKIGFENVLFVMTGVMAVTVVVCYFFIRSKYVNLIKDTPIATDGKPAKTISFFREKAAMPYAIAQVLTMMANSSAMTFLPVYCKSIGLGDISLYFVISAISSVTVRLLAGRLADKYGSGIVLIPCYTLAFINFISLPFVSSLWQIYILGAISGAANGMINPMLQGMMVKKCPGRTGNSSALYYCATDVGLGVGGAVFGAIATALGYRVMYFISAAIVLCALMVYLPSRKTENAEE